MPIAHERTNIEILMECDSQYLLYGVTSIVLGLSFIWPGTDGFLLLPAITLLKCAPGCSATAALFCDQEEFQVSEVGNPSHCRL